MSPGDADVERFNVMSMLDDIEHSATEMAPPQDLRAWVNEQVLVKVVLAAVQSACDSGPISENSRVRLGAGQPRIQLTLLTYSYAVGICASETIETRISSDPKLRYLAAGARPSWHDLRQFRRQNRPMVEEALSRTFQLAWECRRGLDHCRFESAFVRSSHSAMNRLADSERALLFTRAAADRINRAILWDSAALDV